MEGWSSEPSGVCRRAEQAGRSVKVKNVSKANGGLDQSPYKTVNSKQNPVKTVKKS